MGRYVSLAIDPVVSFGQRDIKPGYGTGSFRFFGSSGSFTIPTGVSEVRVTALGGGGSGLSASGLCIGAGGGGAGYVVATTTATPGCVCNVAVGAASGGTSCFGTAIYAYGGCNTSSTTGGAGGTYCVCSGTLIAGRNGNAGCNGNTMCYPSSGTNQCTPTGHGGASGSPIGGAGTGPFPGTSGTDFYACRGFNGEDVAEAELASKFSNTIRWPGETIISTSRKSAVIAGTAAGFPADTYTVTAFGGAFASCSCFTGCAACFNAGCGGGAAGGNNSGNCTCYCAGSYSTNCCIFGGATKRGTGGAGYVVVEF